MKETLLWYDIDDDVVYYAVYLPYYERLVVKNNDTEEVIYIKKNYSKLDWIIFKLRILKWKKRVPDAEEN